MHWKNNRGFSLVELAVVLTVCGLILAISAPGLIRYLDAARVRDAAQTLREEMRLARQKSVTLGTRNYVYTSWGSGPSQYWTGVRTWNDQTKTWSSFTWRGPIDLPSKTKQINGNFGGYIYFYYDPSGRPRQPLERPWPQIDPLASGSIQVVSTVPANTDTMTVNLDLAGGVW